MYCGVNRWQHLGRRLVFAAAAWVAAATIPPLAQAQVLPAVVGGIGGLAAGAHVTTGVYVLRTRATGWVIHSIEDLIAPRPETIPLLVGPIAGAVMGYSHRSTLAQAGLWGGVGLASGAVLGATAGHLIWGDSEGRWAGGVIGSATGLLTGIVVGALRGGSNEDQPLQASQTRELRFLILAPWDGDR